MIIIEVCSNYINRKVFWYQFIATILTYYALSVIGFYVRRHKRYRLLKHYGFNGPKPNLYLDGNLSDLLKDGKSHKVLEEHNRLYGPTWVEYLGDVPIIATTDPALIKHVFIDDSETFSEKVGLPVDLKMSYGILFTTRKAKWKLFRRILNPPLNKLTILTKFVEDSTQTMIDYIDHRIEKPSLKHKSANYLDLFKLFKCNALYLISELAIKLPIGIREDEPNVAGLDQYLETNEGLFCRLAVMFPFLFRIISFLYETIQINGYMKVIYRALERRHRDATRTIMQDDKSSSMIMPENELVIDTLIRLVRVNKLQFREYLGNIEGLLIAGYHTTSSTLIYAIWCLAKHRKVQERLRDELMNKGTDSRYLEQVINETLRMYPVILNFVNRVATKSTIFNGMVIPEGCCVSYFNYLMFRDPVYWKEADKFDPERFAAGKIIDPIYYAPFGFGERRCLGVKLAMLEMKVVITELLSRYRLILVSPEEMQMKTCGFFVSEPMEKVKIRLEKLSNES